MDSASASGALRTNGRSTGGAVIRRHAAVGLSWGIAWGVAARIWMGLITSAPEFSWEGTLSIVGTAGLAGLCLGVVTGAGKAGRSRWWRLTAIPSLMLFMSPGLVFLPVLLLGGWSLAGRGPVSVTVLVGGVGLLAPSGLAWFLESTDPTVIAPRTAQILVGAAVLGLAMAFGGRGMFRRGDAPGTVVVDSDPNDRHHVPRAAHRLSRAGLVDRRSR
ncbi:hypothetical protein [Lapillicoccus sp.]|uniref:hypothetical protein n=1 Tax=Lapillicoccus sp. TaxID=1909287 RepID=UPI0039830501